MTAEAASCWWALNRQESPPASFHRIEKNVSLCLARFGMVWCGVRTSQRPILGCLVAWCDAAHTHPASCFSQSKWRLFHVSATHACACFMFLVLALSDVVSEFLCSIYCTPRVVLALCSSLRVADSIGIRACWMREEHVLGEPPLLTTASPLRAVV